MELFLTIYDIEIHSIVGKRTKGEINIPMETNTLHDRCNSNKRQALKIDKKNVLQQKMKLFMHERERRKGGY